MNKIRLFFIAAVLVFILGVIVYRFLSQKKQISSIGSITDNQQYNQGGLIENDDPLTIASLREDSVNWGMGSDIKIEETLTPGSNYNRYLASYQSEGLKIYALLTIPEGSVPKSGWPVIVFNHGYIPPIEYRTTERYVPYVDGFAKQGYIIFKPDYRGHGSSEGNAAGGYGSNAYTIDVLNAVSSIKKYAPSDADRIGMWGHSMGGYITLRNMVVRKDIKAAVIWAGVVASYPDLLGRWRRGSTVPSPSLTGAARRWRQTLIDKYGTPEQNPDFWNSISANYYLNDISGPLQLHHGIADSSVPVEFSEKLNEQMKNAGKTVELFTYPGDNHNLSLYFSSAMQRSVAFFDKYLKNSVN